jgi:hypothetical protein
MTADCELTYYSAMRIDFDNILEHVTSIDAFDLKWRFIDEGYDKISDQHLAQLKPLDKMASEFLWDYISNSGIHNDIPFKKNYFRIIDEIKVSDDTSKTKKWLYQRGLSFDKPVFLSWDKENAMIVPWKILVKYFGHFYCPIADDLSVIDQSLSWAILFYHEYEIYFGTNSKFGSPTGASLAQRNS